MCAMIGLLYLLGAVQSGRQNIIDVWRTDGMGVEIFRLVMSVNRFKFLLSMLRFDYIGESNRRHRKAIDQLFLIRELFDKFVTNCKRNYNHNASVTVGDMLEPFKGRCSFRSHSSRGRYGRTGIKIFACSDSTSSYTSNMEICLRNQPPGPFYQDNSSQAIVERLVTHIENSGRNITCDCQFTSLSLAENLTNNNLSLVGAMRNSTKELPNMFISTQNKRKASSSMFEYKSNLTLVSYKQKASKVINLISTKQEVRTDSSATDKTSGVAGTPDIVDYYKQNKLGVKVSEVLQRKYSVVTHGIFLPAKHDRCECGHHCKGKQTRQAGQNGQKGVPLFPWQVLGVRLLQTSRIFANYSHWHCQQDLSGFFFPPQTERTKRTQWI